MSSDIVERLQAEVVTCSGKGLDGNGMQHCAECCFGSGVAATTAAELRIMVLARDAAGAIEARDAEIERLRAEVAGLYADCDAWGVLHKRRMEQIEWLREDLAAERAECDAQAALVTAWRGVADGLYGSVDPDFMVGPAVAAYLDLRDKATQ